MLSPYTAPIGLLSSGEGVDLSRFGAVSSVQCQWDERGSASASFNIDLPVMADFPALLKPRRVLFCEGPFELWHGVLDTAQRDSPWQVTAVGLGSYGSANFQCIFSNTPANLIAAGTNPSNDAVDQAIARGMPWTRPFDLPNPWTATNLPPLFPGTIGDFLGLIEKATGEFWTVDPFGNVTFGGLPTSPTWMVDAVDTPGAISSLGFYTTIVATYNNTSGSQSQASQTDTFWQALGFTAEKDLDLTGYGPMSTAQVSNIMTQALQAVAPAPQMTGAVTIHPGHLRNFGGGEALLTSAQTNQMYRMVGVQPQATSGILDISTDVDVIAGQLTYDSDSDVLTLTPGTVNQADPDDILAALLASMLGQPLTAAS